MWVAKLSEFIQGVSVDWERDIFYVPLELHLSSTIFFPRQARLDFCVFSTLKIHFFFHLTISGVV